MGKMINISIIIVHYNEPNILLKCIGSILKSNKNILYEIIIIDNSKDQNIAKIIKNLPYDEKIVYHHMGYNSGFGRANNEGIKLAKGEYILFLNPDIIIQHADTLTKLQQAAIEANKLKKAIIGCKLTNFDGSFQKSLRLAFPGLKEVIWRNPIYIKLVQKIFKKDKKKYFEEKEREAHYKSGFAAWINAAFLLVKRDNILKDRLFFDEDFFLYAEDVEWACRANKHNYQFKHIADVEVVHLGSATMPSEFLKRAQIKLSDWLYLRKSKGFIYMLLYFFVEINTEMLSGFLYRINKNAKTDVEAKKEAVFRKVYWHMIRHYSIDILFLRKLSDKTKFKLNCYEDTFIKEIEEKYA